MTTTARMPPTTLAALLIGAPLALVGTYWWDEAWHTDIGRDSFFAPPHLVPYAGVALALAGVAWWTWRRWHAGGRDGLLGDRPLLLALAGAALTLVAAPIDEAWHALYGRDAVLWSPPHMLGIAGMIALAAGLLAAAARERAPRLVIVALAAFLLAAGVVPVMEYEADVPQFAAVWYLPALIGGATLAWRLAELVRPLAWLATASAALYTLVRAGVVALLALLGHSAAFVPPILVPALAFDLTRRLAPLPRATVIAGAVAASYAPLMNVAYRGVRLTAFDLVVGGLLAIGAAWLVLHAARDRASTRRSGLRGRHRSAAAAALAGLALVVAAGPAAAHDPGQGELVAPTDLRAAVSHDQVRIAATVHHDDCDRLTPRATVARRAGQTRTGPLETAGHCTYSGTVSLTEPGRWFIYVELDTDDKTVEAWLPVVPPEQPTDPPVESRKHDWAYHPAGTDGISLGQITGGTVLYTLMALLLAGALLTGRTHATPRPGQQPAPHPGDRR